MHLHKLDDFTFDGVKASDYNVQMQEPFTLAGAVFSTVYNKKLVGRNGNFVAWDKTYSNRKGTAKCYLLDMDANSKMNAFLNEIFRNPGYRKLYVDSIPGVYLMALITAGPDTQIRNGVLNPFKIQFSCKPQKFLVSGDQEATYTSTGVIHNPTAFPAKPLVTVYGSGSGTVRIGGTTVKILSIKDQITLDCERMDAYRQVGDSAAENKNSAISAPEFPELNPGENDIYFSGGITRIDITPRWWTL